MKAGIKLGQFHDRTCNKLVTNPRQEDITPWDAGGVQPPLRDLLLSDKLDWPRRGRALVPGCGRVSHMLS